MPILVFCCSIFCSFLQMLILPTMTLPVPFPSYLCLLSMLVGSHPSHLPQHVQVLPLWIPNTVYFSSSRAFLLPLFLLTHWVYILVSLQVPYPVSIFSACSFCFSVAVVSTACSSLSSGCCTSPSASYSLLCQPSVFILVLS